MLTTGRPGPSLPSNRMAFPRFALAYRPAAICMPLLAIGFTVLVLRAALPASCTERSASPFTVRTLRAPLTPEEALSWGMGAKLVRIEPDRTPRQDPGAVRHRAWAASGRAAILAFADRVQEQHTGDRIGVGYSADAGRTFRLGLPPRDPNGGRIANDSASDSVFGTDTGHPALTAGPAAAFYLAAPWTDVRGARRMAVFTSKDGGQSWSEPASVTNNVYYKSYPSLAWEPTKDSNGVLYVCYSLWDQTGGGSLQLGRSTDGGQHFQPVQVPFSVNRVRPICRLATEPADAQGNAPVCVAWLDPGARNGEGQIRFARSADGATWIKGGARVLASLASVKGNASPKDAKRRFSAALEASLVPSVVVDRGIGAVYVAYVNGNPGGTGLALFLISSSDHGTTWSSPRKINSSPVDTDCLPSLAVTDDSQVRVSYFGAERHSSRNVMVATYDPRQDRLENQVATEDGSPHPRSHP